MQDNCFADTNVLLYTLDKGSIKQSIAFALWRQGLVLSTQVIMEFTNVCIRKLKFTREDAYKNALNLMDGAKLKSITPKTIKTAFEVLLDYGYSHWDSLVIASALEARCQIVYTEDLQHDQLINGKLKVVNPFS